jgi:hypothetical protein
MEIDPAAFSDNAYTFEQLVASPFCFAVEAFELEAPGFSGLSPDQLAPLTRYFDAAVAGMNCSSIGSVNRTIIAECPGFSFYGGPTGVVAPGAIQN